MKPSMKFTSADMLRPTISNRGAVRIASRYRTMEAKTKDRGERPKHGFSVSS
jgi:hypothetical protein